MGPKRKSSSAQSSGSAGKKVDDGRETPLQAILLAGNYNALVILTHLLFTHSFRFLHQDIPSYHLGLTQSSLAGGECANVRIYSRVFGTKWC